MIYPSFMLSSTQRARPETDRMARMPRPSPAQARFLRELNEDPSRAVQIWNSRIVWADGDRSTYPSNRQTIMACVRLGWTRRLAKEEVREHGWYSSDEWGAGPGYYIITPEGQRAVVNLPEDAFLSPPFKLHTSVNGMAAIVLRGLACRHELPEWVFLTEPSLRNKEFIAHIDAFALNCFASKKFQRIGYEVKVSRADFLNELKHPDKTVRGAFFCTSFFFACPPDLIHAKEVPDPYGLVFVRADGRSRMVKRSALPDQPPTWGTVATLMRRYSQEESGLPDWLDQSVSKDTAVEHGR